MFLIIENLNNILTCTLAYNGFSFTNGALGGELSNWHSYRIFLCICTTDDEDNLICCSPLIEKLASCYLFHINLIEVRKVQQFYVMTTTIVVQCTVIGHLTLRVFWHTVMPRPVNGSVYLLSSYNVLYMKWFIAVF